MTKKELEEELKLQIRVNHELYRFNEQLKRMCHIFAIITGALSGTGIGLILVSIFS